MEAARELQASSRCTAAVRLAAHPALALSSSRWLCGPLLPRCVSAFTVASDIVPAVLGVVPAALMSLSVSYICVYVQPVHVNDGDDTCDLYESDYLVIRIICPH